MIKCIIECAVIVVSLAIGMVIKNELQRREEALRTLRSLNDELIRNLRFPQKPQEELIKGIKEPMAHIHCKQLSDYESTVSKGTRVDQLEYLSQMSEVIGRLVEEASAKTEKQGVAAIKLSLLCGLLIVVLLL